ncbi:MAG: AAA family ATPase [Lachnospiraceae bacterium]|nr:AAA family ATPase [Lachnospiraceae bacterium]
MRIHKIHIENFGTFSDFTCTLEEGVNRISRENGWGKTTFAVFVRAMFYGFPSKGEGAKDRERYRPWNGGAYGGSLTFSAQGQTFTIHRVFGKSRSGREDSFFLRDEKTGRESGRWSRQIGLELFGMNEESYENSAWIRQDGCTVTGDLASGLGGQEDLLEDMRQYDRVMELLEKRKNRLSPDRKTGLIYRKRLNKQEAEAELLRIGSLERTILQQKAEKAELEQQLQSCGQRLEQLQNLQRRYIEQQDYLSARKVHERLQKEYLQRDEIWERQQNTDTEDLPEGESEHPSGGKPERWVASGLLLLAAAVPVFLLSHIISSLLIAAGLFLAGTGLWLYLQSRQVQKPDQYLQLLRKQRQEESAKAAWRELQRADRELRRFYEAYPDFEEQIVKTPEVLPETLGELNRQIQDLQVQQKQLEQDLQERNRAIEKKQEEREHLAEKEEQLSILTKELDLLEKEYQTAELTAGYLRCARDACAGRYMDSIQSTFLRYYKMIDPGQKEQLYLDADFRICCMGGVLPRSEEILSSGYRSLAALCLRFAILEAMYEKEPPPVIMDDSFLFLDDDKTERAHRFLDLMSRTYQIIFLSCKRDG